MEAIVILIAGLLPTETQGGFENTRRLSQVGEMLSERMEFSIMDVSRKVRAVLR
jgi:hypothetical protein